MMSTMSYDVVIDELAEGVEGLPVQGKAALFWIVGTALEAELGGAEGAGWASWSRLAGDLSLQFILEGTVDDRVREAWEQAPGAAGPNSSQLFQSVVICLSSPLVIALEPDRHVGHWIEHALFPVVQKISLDLFGDVAFPDDEGLEAVVADGRFQAARDYCTSLCVRLRGDAPLGRDSLAVMLREAKVLIG